MEWFRSQVRGAGGGNYQSLINPALREHIRAAGEPLEETLRRVLREEVHRLSAYLDECAMAGPVIITRNGKPVALACP